MYIILATHNGTIVTKSKADQVCIMRLENQHGWIKSKQSNGIEEISPQRKYHGISVQIIGKIENVRVPFNIDMGIGDVIVPHAVERRIQTQLPDFEKPVIMTYSLESTIAEKFDAILQRFELTGRMKDFYDIYYLARTFDFDGARLQTAIARTLARRETPYDRDSFKRVVALAEDAKMQKRWKYFLKNIKRGVACVLCCNRRNSNIP